jgi:hypothetical protein
MKTELQKLLLLFCSLREPTIIKPCEEGGER